MPDDANRFIEDKAQSIFVNHVRGAFFGTNDAREVTEMVGTHWNINVHCLANGLAVVERLNHCEVLFVRVDNVGDFEENCRAFGDRSFFPLRKSFPRGFYGVVNVLFARGGNFAHELAVSGIVNVESFATFSVAPFTADVKLIAVLPNFLRNRCH